MTSPASPTKLYNEFNRQFFGGRLPRYRVTVTTSTLSAGMCLSDRRLIQLQRGLDPKTLRRFLLHEMCHIGTPYHGRRFQEKLLRLAAQGEVWAKEEADKYKYRKAPSWNHEMAKLRLRLYFLAWGSKPPRRPFLDVVAWAAYDLGLSPLACFRSTGTFGRPLS